MSQQYVSLADGTISPDQRVNYEFGVVLGVNEFRQEQEYFLEKDYLSKRELHGYGTVSGLKVTVQVPSDKSDDLAITVEPGMAIDQQGRAIVVRDTLCARLGAWLAKQDQANLDAQGNGHIYVVASYTSYPDALVPLPGQPCSSCDTTQAPSRIHDSYNVELRWDLPAQPAWDAEHCFARLMAQVRFMPEFPYELSDEQNIINYIRALDQPCPEAFSGILSDRFLLLPAINAREALGRIFTIWVTEMRPKLSSHLLASDASEAAVMLARIDFTAQKATTPGALWSISAPQLSTENRPFLLDTQFMQEFLLQRKNAEPEREFATLQALDSHTLQVWIHHPNPLIIHPVDKNDLQQIILMQDETPLTISSIVVVENHPDVLTITVTETLASGARIALAFGLNAIQATNPRANQQQLLQVDVDTLDFAYIGHDRIANTITAYTIANYPNTDNGQSISSNDISTLILHLPTQPFVTITPILSATPTPPDFELWFHLNLDPTNNATFFKSAPGLILYAETGGNSPSVQSIDYSITGNPQTNVFLLQPDATSWKNAASPGYLRFAFAIDSQTVVLASSNQTIQLVEYIAESGIKFEGYDGKDAIIAYVRVPGGGKG